MMLMIGVNYMTIEEFMKEVLHIEEKYFREKGNRAAVVRKIINLLDGVWEDDSEKSSD